MQANALHLMLVQVQLILMPLLIRSNAKLSKE